jgi:hypothetical protein
MHARHGSGLTFPSPLPSALPIPQQIRAAQFVPSRYLAAVHLGLGKTRQRLDLLEQAYQERTDRMIYLGVDPIADPLRGDPRFRQLVGGELLKSGVCLAKTQERF